MRHQWHRLLFVLVLCTLASASGLMAQSLQVTRADGTSATLTAAQIATLPHVSVDVKDHDTPAQ
ncbi:MAG TPA: molybdopterin-binding protein, partial [Candidatus Angelobacter sp.]|nr:molybdopterin-binding protein [Candidatus Angelobacter sp.]